VVEEVQRIPSCKIISYLSSINAAALVTLPLLQMMDTNNFFQKIRTYANLSAEAEEAWLNLLSEKKYLSGENFIRNGQIPKKVAFVLEGLFSQYYITDNGSTVIKYFFPEGRIAGSIPATLTKSESLFTITALEDTTVLEYDFHEFKKLVAAYNDIATFYIRYMEQHWIIDKEPYEISLRNDSAKLRYDEFLKRYPGLEKRLKKHHIAAYLGITPTQLSRIFVAGK
jgi:CRP-like cAMP-binding protein